jgi:CspA family cold shock protein
MVAVMLAKYGLSEKRTARRGSTGRYVPSRSAKLFKAVDAITPTPHNAAAMSEEEGKRIWFENINQPLVDPNHAPTGAGTSARRNVKRGRVKFYNQEKGWGFVEPQKKGEIDVFVHYSSIKKDGWRSLMPGEPVEYTVVMQPDGRPICGTVTGPDGADVQGYSTPGERGDRAGGEASSKLVLSDALGHGAERERGDISRVTDWLRTVDTVVITKNALFEQFEAQDEAFDDTFGDFDDTIYINDDFGI